MKPIKESFIREGKGIFYLGIDEPINIDIVNAPGFEIFKEQIIENLVQDNKERVMKQVIEKMRTMVVKELLCLLPKEELPLDLASLE